MEKLEMAIAGFVDRLKKYIASGMATPPPPIPATLLRHIIRENTNVPTHSLGYMGNRGLWTHSLSFPASMSTPTSTSTSLQIK